MEQEIEQISVDKIALRAVLQALSGESYLIRELQVMREMDHSGISDELSPIGVLIADFNKSI
jgi:hypothetical protein